MEPAQRLGLLLLVLMLAAGPGCDSTSTEPEDETEVPIAVATVGGDGGTLTDGDFALVVPSGAFAGSTELQLYASTVDHGYGDHTCSRSFRLEGLPEEYADSLEVRMTLVGTLSGQSFISIGRPAEASSGEILSDLSNIYFKLFPATVSGSELVATIPPTGVAQVRDGAFTTTGAGQCLFNALTSYGTTLTSAHFEVEYPEGMLSYAEQIAEFLEAGHDTALAIGLDYGHRGWEWPGPVIIKEIPCSNVLHGMGYGQKIPPSFSINRGMLSPEEMGSYRVQLGSKMVMLAIDTMDPYGFTSGHYWWNHAVELWSRDRFVDPPFDAHSEYFSGREMEPFTGVERRDTSPTHSEGMAPFVEFVVSKYGRETITTIYEHVRAGTYPATEAILAVLPEPEYNWLPDFFDRYIRGTIFDVPADKLLSNITGEWTIDGSEDTEYTFPHACPELGANIYRINLRYSSINSGSSLTFEPTAQNVNPDYLTVMVYSIKNSVFELLDSGGSATINGLDILTSGGYDLIAVVVNSYGETPYTGNTALCHTVRVSHGMLYDYCSITLSFTATYQYEGGQNTWGGPLTMRWRASGAFQGATFTGQLDQNYHGPTTTGTVALTLDPTSRVVTSLSATAVQATPGDEGEWNLGAVSIPVYGTYSEYVLENRVTGAATCGHITACSFYEEDAGYPKINLVGWECESDAKIEIELIAYGR